MPSMLSEVPEVKPAASGFSISVGRSDPRKSAQTLEDVAVDARLFGGCDARPSGVEPEQHDIAPLESELDGHRRHRLQEQRRARDERHRDRNLQSDEHAAGAKPRRVADGVLELADDA